MAVQIDKVIALNIDIDDWDKYIGFMVSDYRDIWIDDYDLRYSIHNRDYNGLLEICDEFKEAKCCLETGAINFIVLRADID